MKTIKTCTVCGSYCIPRKRNIHDNHVTWHCENRKCKAAFLSEECVDEIRPSAFQEEWCDACKKQPYPDCIVKDEHGIEIRRCRYRDLEPHVYQTQILLNILRKLKRINP